MRQLTIALLLVLCHLVLGACQAADDHSSSTTVTLLFTNDVESAYDPIEAFWRDPANRRSNTWTEHRDINEVMLATSLAPDGYLMLLPLE